MLKILRYLTCLNLKWIKRYENGGAFTEYLNFRYGEQRVAEKKH